MYYLGVKSDNSKESCRSLSRGKVALSRGEAYDVFFWLFEVNQSCGSDNLLLSPTLHPSSVLLMMF